jgi:D-glycero-D-manno-heptose 1,7-bisphosphate phosphatase
MRELKNKACFLDRDGVINRAIVKEGKPYPPEGLSDFEILPGVVEGLRALRKSGYLLIVITNQPDVGRGTQKKEVVEAMHQRLLQDLPLDDIEVCYDEASERYKPLPGMILDSAKKHQVDLASSYMIGDRWRDIGAGKAAGCLTIFIDRKYSEKMIETPNFVCFSLKEAAKTILDRGSC